MSAGSGGESLSDDETALYQFEARRLLNVSQALRAGRVRLKQGVWQNGIITLCQGGTVAPNFDARAAGWPPVPVIRRAHWELLGLKHRKVPNYC